LKNIYIFDVDGTLTPSRKVMTKEFLKFFDTWSKENTFYLVSGSDLEKMSEQVPPHILERATGLFCCGGNHYYKDGKQVYYNEFSPPEDLIQFLQEMVLNSQYGERAGNHIENRGSMVNFSVVGRDCSDEQREDYFQYDLQSREREIIAGLINEQWIDIQAVIGGQISIDIAPRGNDKSQVLKHIIKEQPNKKYFFVGDRTMEGGNDYPLANLMNNTDDCYVYQAGKPSDKFGYRHTEKILSMLRENYKEERPWGSFEHLLETDYCKVKRIIVKSGERLSYQYHHKRSECWVIVQGQATMTLDGKDKLYGVGEIVGIPVGTKHRVFNRSKEELIFIETQTGTYFGEDDIVRIEDEYGRE
jgi:phosphomannomutase